MGGGFTNFDERPRAAIARLLNSSDSAAGALEFTQPAYTVWENGGTNLVLKVRRSGGTQGPVQVNYAVAGGTGAGFLYSDAGEGYAAGRLDRFHLHSAQDGYQFSGEVEGDFPWPYGPVKLRLHGFGHLTLADYLPAQGVS